MPAVESCPGSGPLVSCDFDYCPECEAQGAALFPITFTALLAVGYCVPASATVDPIDYRGDDNTTGGLQSRMGGPGYFVDRGVLKVCDSGYYCPLNATAGYYDKKVECTDGEVCPQGYSEVHECSTFANCDGKQIYAGAGALLLFFVLLVLLIALLMYTVVIARKQLKQSQELAALYDHYDVDAFGSDFRDQADTEQNLVVPATMEFENIGLTLKKAKPGDSPILQGVTGRIPPKSLVALMGPSGCGKTTFMNAILQNTPYGNCTGTVKINGRADVNIAQQQLAGFVPQDDIVRADLTVFQNFYYNAMVRLPASIPTSARLKHVQNTIKVLGLGKVQNNIVGTPEKRGISGGQKKRVNIGMELVAMPSFLFMDEPTSGLDGAATVSLANCMTVLRKAGLTIMCVIHQPRWAVFEQFTHVLLLGEGGRTIYWGRSEHLVPYLNSVGFAQPEHENPADWMIDVCSGLQARVDPATGVEDKSFSCPDDLYTAWATKQQPHALEADFPWTQGDPHDQSTTLQELKPRKDAGLLSKMLYLTGRSFRQLDRTTVVQDVLFVFLGNLFEPLLFIVFTIGVDIPFTVEDNPKKFRMGSLHILLIVLQHRKEYGDARLIVARELNAGIGVLPLFGSGAIRTFCLVFLKALAAAIAVYALYTPLQGFGNFFFAWLLGTWAWALFAQVVSLYVPNQVTAMLILILLPFFEVLYNGQNCLLQFDDDVALNTCPRGMLYRLPFPPFWGGWATVGLPTYWIMWATEMKEWPDHFVNDSFVNKSDYFYDISDLDPSTEAVDPDYDAIIRRGVVILFLLIISHHVAIMLLMNSMQNWVAAMSRKREENRKKTCDSLFAFICSPVCSLFGLKDGLEHKLNFDVAPARDVQDRMVRQRSGMTNVTVKGSTTSSASPKSAA